MTKSDYWKAFTDHISKKPLKTYLHIDPLFDFNKSGDLIKEVVTDESNTLIKSYGFLPFLKIVTKTPRYKYFENEADPTLSKYKLQSKKRPILFAGHKDSYILAFYAFMLNIRYQTYIRNLGISDSILAYRTDLDGQCNIQFAKTAFDSIKDKINANSNCTAIALDITGYFNNIDHSILKEMWCKVLGKDKLTDDYFKLYRILTKYTYVKFRSVCKHFEIDVNEVKFPNRSIMSSIGNRANLVKVTEKMNLLRKKGFLVKNKKASGIPQGTSMSAVLSNIYLVDFDVEVDRLSKEKNFKYYRYCDDILIVCESKRTNEIYKEIVDLLTNKYLQEIQAKKTEVVDFKSWSKTQEPKFRAFKRKYNKESKLFKEKDSNEDNFTSLQYLGFEFNGQNIFVRSSSLSRYFRKMKARLHKSTSMAYSPNSKADVIFKKQIHYRYSHFGKRNFITYIKNAASKSYTNSKGEVKYGLDSKVIRKQLAQHMKVLRLNISKKSSRRARKKGKSIILK